MRELERILSSVRGVKQYLGFLAFDCLIQMGVLVLKGVDTIETVKIFFQQEIDDLYCAECNSNLEPVREFFFRRILNERL